tara:strand:- start:7488 stop:8459 length:972 start_codon:yes stop_codon:yes gene_type:complete
MKKYTKILIVGAGPMAIEYAKVLKAQKSEFITVGNTKKGANNFKKDIKTHVVLGGIENWLKNNPSIDFSSYKVIVVVNEHLLGKVTRILINAGFKNILLEKPGGLNIDDIQSVNSLAIENKVDIYIAYNRRFFASTLKLKKLIKADGGVISFNFEFTEWGHIIKDLVKDGEILKEWFIQNSSHVVDLAFNLGGNPVEMKSFVSGGQSWHPKGTIFSGAGITDKGALFSYNANWDSAGRWWVEFLTKENRYIMKPMEQLFVQKKGSVMLDEIELDDKLDKTFKPGLYKQVEAYLNWPDKLMNINNQVMMLPNYKKILGGIKSKR